jgi:Flp pilus assembly protein TadG
MSSGVCQPVGCPLRDPRRERGSMAVEVVLITPVLVAFLLLVISFGRYVAVRGDVESATRDAVRAASIERSSGSAVLAARRTASASLTGHARCQPAELSGGFAAGGTITATLSCSVPLTDLGLLGLPGSVSVSASSSAPLDLYRRTV